MLVTCLLTKKTVFLIVLNLHNSLNKGVKLLATFPEKLNIPIICVFVSNQQHFHAFGTYECLQPCF